MIIKEPLAADIPALKSLWQQAFGDPQAVIAGFFSTGFAFDRCRCLLEGNRLCAALYWFDCLFEGKKVAYLYAVATDAQKQGKGYCRALMENTHRHLRAQGYAGAVLVPGSDGLFALYEKLGYLPFCPMEKVTVSAESPTALNTLSAEKYAALRPEKGIIHTEAAYAFLGTYASFYAAEQLMFCGSVEDGTLYVQEFFGNETRLPGAAGALGAEKCTARLPGAAPYAMYLPLADPDFCPDFFSMPLD